MRRRAAEVNGVLLYGSDTGSVRERAATLVRVNAGSLDDPFNVVRLDEAVLADDPGRLADEYNAISMMGGRRVIWVSDADKVFHKAVEPLLENPNAQSLLVAEAGNLAKASGLRLLFERGRNIYALPCYQDTDQDLHELIRTELEAVGVAIEPDAERLLIGLLSADRMLSRSEVSKLALYAMGSGTVTMADVAAVCGDASAFSVDDVIDAVFEGELAACDEALTRLVSSGTQVGAVLSQVAGHVARLQHFRVEMDRGRSADETVRSARPPVFFKRVDGMIRQLRLWDAASLLNAGTSIATAVRQTRDLPALDEAIANRALLSLARNARLLRSERF